MNISNLNSEQKQALRELMITNNNLYITGSAGTGKTHVIKTFREINKLAQKQIPLVASTGVASILVNGVTFNSFFGLGILHGGMEKTIENASQNFGVCERIVYADSIIVDEFSMIGGEAFRTADLLCRKVRNNKSFFGGIRMIFVGDFYQLGPFSKSIKTDWAFLSPSWNEGKIKVIELTEIMRTKENDFLQPLAKIRLGNIDESVEFFLKSRLYKGKLEDFEGPRLFGTNKQVDDYNNFKLKSIESPLFVSETQFVGQDNAVKKLKEYLVIDEKLYLKKGALIMLRVNNFDDGYVNGTVGHVVNHTNDVVSIRTLDNRMIRIKKHVFELLNGDGDVIARAKNFPITLAWAVTIHKSQGATMDTALISLENLWLHGQAYTALSRLSSAKNLYITGYNKKSFIIDPQVIKFFKKNK